MRDRCPKCGGKDLRAEQTKIVGMQNKSKFDIYCRKCGYIGTGNVVNEKTRDQIKDSDIDKSVGDK